MYGLEFLPEALTPFWDGDIKLGRTKISASTDSRMEKPIRYCLRRRAAMILDPSGRSAQYHCTCTSISSGAVFAPCWYEGRLLSGMARKVNIMDECF